MSGLWGPQNCRFSVYSSIKSQLLHLFDNYKFSLYPFHSCLCPHTPSLFIHSYSARGLKSPFCSFSGLARRSSPPPLSSSCSWLTAGARPRLTFVISNPAGSAHKKSVVNSLSDLIPPLLFLMVLPSPSSPLFSHHYLS